MAKFSKQSVVLGVCGVVTLTSNAQPSLAENAMVRTTLSFVTKMEMRIKATLRVKRFKTNQAQWYLLLQEQNPGLCFLKKQNLLELCASQLLLGLLASIAVMAQNIY